MLDLRILILQIIVVLITARVVGYIFRKVHQPQVVGEMFAGILLGPSALGWIAPGVSAALFPPASLGFLNSLSQVGLLLFMFVVGLHLNLDVLRRRAKAAVLTSHVSIAVPFALGAGLAFYLYPRLSRGDVNFIHFTLFLGTAMSITAFPVLARILTETRLVRTEVGAVALACAAVDDVTAWCLLAAVVLLVRASAEAPSLWLMLFGSITYILFMLFVVRRLLRRLAKYYEGHVGMRQNLFAMVLLVLLVSSLATEWLGIHALFGAFLAGAVMPKQDAFAQELTIKLEDVTVVLLLPIFFAFTGLRTSISLMAGAGMWGYCALIIAVAVAGKLGGASISARVSGMTWREASAVGILMNTRGLMELVVLNIGLDIGVISPELFTMMVIMALITTAATTPLLKWVYPVKEYEQSQAGIPLRREPLA